MVANLTNERHPVANLTNQSKVWYERSRLGSPARATQPEQAHDLHGPYQKLDRVGGLELACLARLLPGPGRAVCAGAAEAAGGPDQ